MPRNRLPNSATDPPILLVGNGPNRVLPDSLSWGALMQSLRGIAGMREGGHEFKPFPLHFEEIRNSFLARNPRARESEFLGMVAEATKAMRPNAVHRRLTRLAVSDILTTNYDDCLERSLAATARVDNFDTNETKHSLFRRSRIGRRYFWHIHGDIFNSGSVLVGHDRYVEGCSRIRRYQDAKLGILFKAHSSPLCAHFLTPDVKLDPRKPHSWVDLLLLRDVHIVGFGLDYTEVDLWYLLSLRQRLRANPSPNRNTLRRTRIVYHHIGEQDEGLRQKFELLASFDVEVRVWSLRGVDWMRAWDRLLKELEGEIGTWE
jgi:hypothetical protein